MTNIKKQASTTSKPSKPSKPSAPFFLLSAELTKKEDDKGAISLKEDDDDDDDDDDDNDDDDKGGAWLSAIGNEKKGLVLKSKKKFRNVKISKELRDIIHGYIMSDGYVKPEGSLQVDNSVDQESFVVWMYKKLELLRTNNPTVGIHGIKLVSRYDKRTKKYTYSKRFFTRNLIKGFHKMWYSENTEGEISSQKKGGDKYIKHLPKSLDCFFSPTFLTLWFAGDGTKPDHRGAKFEVTNYTPEERIRLQNLFKTKFNLNVGIIRSGVSKSGTPQFAIVIYANEYNTFREIITQSDLITTCFPYKLHKKT